METDAQDADYIAELPYMSAAWDEAVAYLQREQQRKNAPKPQAPGGRRMVGPGMNAQ